MTASASKARIVIPADVISQIPGPPCVQSRGIAPSSLPRTPSAVVFPGTFRYY